jgi:serine/threonine protein kinase
MQPHQTLEQLYNFRRHVGEEAEKRTSGINLLNGLLTTSGGRLTFVARGAFGNVFRLDKPFPMAVKFAPGSVSSKSYKASRQAEVAKHLEKVLLLKLSPHISAIATAFWVKTSALPKDAIIFPKKLDREPKKQTLVIFSEWADGGDMLQLLRNNELSEIQLKVMLFQVLFTLAKIQEIFPKFKHNDLKPNNVLLVKQDAMATRECYRLSPTVKFFIPMNPWSPRINDFDLSTVNSKKPNLYNDMHFFFATIGKFSQQCDKPLPREIRRFFKSVMDTEGPFKESNPCRYIGTREPTTPKDVLETHPFFEEWRRKKS